MVDHLFIDTPILKDHLAPLFLIHNPTDVSFDIISREPSIHSSTFPSEIVSCKKGEKFFKLFCKYTGNQEHNCFGHRGGIEYEAKIYEEVLNSMPITTVHFFGYCADQKNNETWLVIEYLENCIRMKESRGPEIFSKTSTWLANLHRLCEGNVPSFVKKYDEAYYRLWVDRIEEEGQGLKQHFPWLHDLCNYYYENLHLLTEGPQTLIHGEFYSGNILIKDEIIYPVDWESAAYAAGEIDLACLIHGWDEERIDIAVNNYRSMRWPAGGERQDQFNERLLIARLYSYFRWIGEWAEYKDEWLKKPETFEQLYVLAQQAEAV